MVVKSFAVFQKTDKSYLKPSASKARYLVWSLKKICITVLHIQMKINICIHIDLYVYIYIEHIWYWYWSKTHMHILWISPVVKGIIGSSPPIFHLAPCRLPPGPGGTTGSCHGAPSDTWRSRPEVRWAVPWRWPYGRYKVDHPMTWRPVVNNHGDRFHPLNGVMGPLPNGLFMA